MNTQTRFPRTRASVEAGVISSLPAVLPATRPLTKSEASDLASCEAKIFDGFHRMGKIGQETIRLLRHIHDEKLYREKFRFFKDYYQATFGKSVRRAMQIMSFDEALEELQQAGVPPALQPQHEGQTRYLAKGQRAAAWEAARELAAPGKQPTTKQVAAAVERSKWPQPGTNGYYDTGKAESLRFSHKDGTAEILLLQVLAQQWIWSVSWRFMTGSMENLNAFLRAPGDSTELAESREEALMLAVAKLKSKGLTIVRSQEGVTAKSQRVVAQKMVDWAHRFLSAEAKPDTKSRADGQWVICRPPLSGATSPSAMIARYSGPGWGWSPNPEKGKPFTNKQTALTEAARHGAEVVSLDEARRPVPATVQVRAHERTIGESPEAQDLEDAKFRVIDAEVELRAALVILKNASGGLTQELYHAEKAQDHLACLKELLANGGGKKGKR